MNRPCPGWGGLAAGLAGMACASAVFAAGPNCRFQARNLAVDFGVLNPADARTVAAPAVAVSLHADRAGDCTGVNFVISADEGLHFGRTRRMRSAAGAFLPYTLEGIPTRPQPGPGDGVYVRFSVAAKLQALDYINAPAGVYRDTVILTISP